MPQVHKILGSGSTSQGVIPAVTNVAIASNICTLTFAASHGLSAGHVVNVWGVNAAADGLRVIATVPTTTTATFAVPTATLASVACVGVAEQIVGASGVALSSFRADGNAATLTCGSAHGRAVGDLIQVNTGDASIDGLARVIAVPSSTTLVVPTSTQPYTLASVSRAGAIGLRLPAAATTVYTAPAGNGTIVSSLRLTNYGSSPVAYEVLLNDVIVGRQVVQLLPANGIPVEVLAGITVDAAKTVKVRIGGPSVSYILTGMESS